MNPPAAATSNAAPPRPRRRIFAIRPGRGGADFKVEDAALALGYLAAIWLLHAVNVSGAWIQLLPTLASLWPAFAALGCAGVLFRRACPTAMAWLCGSAIAGLVLAGQDGAFLLTFELFFSLVLFGSPRASRWASRTAWALTVALVVLALAASQNAGNAVAAAVVAVVTLLTPAEWAGNLRKANQLADSESARANAVADAAAARLFAERSRHELDLEHERQHLARELHDVISARLSAIALQSGGALQAAKHSPGDMAPATVSLLGNMRAESVAGLDELGAMIRLLHSRAAQEPLTHDSGLRALVDRHRAAGMDVQLAEPAGLADDVGSLLPPPAHTALCRIAAEALGNAAKHAPGQPVAISLDRKQPPGGPGGNGRAPHVVLEVGNPLSSSRQAAAGTGTGIPSMHFRAAHVGGTVAVGPSEGTWQVRLQLPTIPAETDGQ